MKSKIRGLLILIFFLANATYAKETVKLASPLKCLTYFDQNQQKSHTISKNGYFRVKTKEIIPNLYLMQDYYSDSMKKATDAYLIQDMNDINEFTPKSIEGNLVLYNENGNKIFVIPYVNGEKTFLFS